jgi:hypothetical protein
MDSLPYLGCYLRNATVAECLWQMLAGLKASLPLDSLRQYVAGISAR